MIASSILPLSRPVLFDWEGKSHDCKQYFPDDRMQATAAG